MKNSISIRLASVALAFFFSAACGALAEASDVGYSVEFQGSWLTLVPEIPVEVNSRWEAELIDAWRGEAAQRCGGSFVGEPELQISAAGVKGSHFEDPLDQSSSRTYTVVAGEFMCTMQGAGLLKPEACGDLALLSVCSAKV